MGGAGKAWQWVHEAALPKSLWLKMKGWRPVPLTFLPPLTASSVNSEVTGPNTASQHGLLPSNSSTAPESSSSSTASQAASGLVTVPRCLTAAASPASLGQAKGMKTSTVIPNVAVLRLHRVQLRDASQHLPVRGHHGPQGLPKQLAAAGPDRESGLGREAAPQYNLRRHVPTAIPKGALGGATHQLQGLRVAPSATADGEHWDHQGIPQRLIEEASAGSQCRPRHEAVPLWNVGLQNPGASSKDTAGASPGDEGQPRCKAAPGYVGPRIPTAGPNEAAGLAGCEPQVLAHFADKNLWNIQNSARCHSIH